MKQTPLCPNGRAAKPPVVFIRVHLCWSVRGSECVSGSSVNMPWGSVCTPTSHLTQLPGWPAQWTSTNGVLGSLFHCSQHTSSYTARDRGLWCQSQMGHFTLWLFSSMPISWDLDHEFLVLPIMVFTGTGILSKLISLCNDIIATLSVFQQVFYSKSMSVLHMLFIGKLIVLQYISGQNSIACL